MVALIDRESSPPATSAQDPAQAQAVVFIDMVESVLLLARFRDSTIARWTALVTQIKDRMLPCRAGRLVRHQGDSVLLLFPSVTQAVGVVEQINAALDDLNVGVQAEAVIRLRTAIQFCDVVDGGFDVFGNGVNEAARLLGSAAPGEVLLTSEANAQLHPSLDRETEDLGERWFKHLPEPIRVHRLCADPASPMPVARKLTPPTVLQLAIAVLPFEAVGESAQPVAELLSDELICALSMMPDLRVTSRLSANATRARGGNAERGRLLGVDYLVCGRCHVNGDRLLLHAELHDVRRGEVIQQLRVAERTDALFDDECEPLLELSAKIRTALLQQQIDLAHRCALPDLAAHSLLLGGVVLMHRLGRRDVFRSYEMLEQLCERWPRLAIPHAWKARWHLLSRMQGWNTDAQRDARQAFENCDRALDIDPGSSIALAVLGSLRTNIDRDVDAGIRAYEEALRCNPSDPFAWMLLGTAHAFKGDGEAALHASDCATRLSPLDPMHFMYDCHAAGAALAAGKHGQALTLAVRSMRANAWHLSTYRVLALAQMLSGQEDDARATIRRLLVLDPKASVAAYLKNSATAHYAIGQRFARLLAQAGLPQSTGG